MTTGTVLYKRHINFGKGETSYVNAEGRKVTIDAWRRKSGEDRVYYRLDDLNQIPEPHRKSLLDSEEEREKNFGPRFSIADQHFYKAANSGDKLQITYRWASDTQLEIIEVGMLETRRRP